MKEPLAESSPAFRKTVAITLIGIGSLMVTAGVFIVKEKRNPTALLSGISLMALGAVLFSQRIKEPNAPADRIPGANMPGEGVAPEPSSGHLQSLAPI